MSSNGFPAPVTYGQRLALMRERARYEQQQHLTPDNALSGYVHSNLERQRESQITYISERLQSAHDHMRPAWHPTTQEGHAKARFNHAAAPEVASSTAPSPAPSHDVGHER